jgi:hypothetical protein
VFSGFVDATSLDTINAVICGRTAALSPFVIGERVQTPAELIVALIEAIKGRTLRPAVEARLVATLQAALANPLADRRRNERG